jgi:antibiotic biosynthesis monooxygenase (ABM) superfamily enzyme
MVRRGPVRRNTDDQPHSWASARPGPTAEQAPAQSHDLACVFPTLTVINLALGDWLKTFSPVLRTFVLATIAVPIVIYGLMPYLHRLRVRLMTTRAGGA